MATPKLQQSSSRRVNGSSPPSPKVKLNLSRVNSDFYAAPTFDDSKKKTSSILPQFPSPTALDISALPDDPFTNPLKEHMRNRSSNPTSPIISTSRPVVAVTKASSRPVSSQISLNSVYSENEDEEAEEFYDDDMDDDLGEYVFMPGSQQPFMVNPSDINPRPASRNSKLPESVQRGIDRLHALEPHSASREGSPIPTHINLDHIFQERQELEVTNAQLQKTIQDLQQRNHYLEQKLKNKDRDFDAMSKDLQQKLAIRERDYDIMSKNFLDHVRLIRATDDDHSTVTDKLTQLKNSIEHMIRKTQGTKSVNLNKAAAIEHFKSSGLLREFPLSENNLEPYLLNLYMESVIMSNLVAAFFDKPLSCVFEYNSGFKDIYEWMYARNSKLAIRWRQQLCVMLTQDTEIKTRQEELVAKTANDLVAIISKIYSNSNEVAKIREICTKAFELSVVMTALEFVISPTFVQTGIPFDEEKMAPSLKSNPDGKVALVIFPEFRDTQENGYFSKSKVWCY
ncbi:hypothetical protein BGZ49_002741 [Haplosporangium sp. Z 27]|nr:hypothetical protein BGZ49_002741 [Haplosporangium sp. Z 27]